MKATLRRLRYKGYYLYKRLLRKLSKKPPEKEVYVYSYPKSGRTWLRLMLDMLNTKCESIAYVHGDAVPKKGRHFRKMTFNLAKLKEKQVIFLVRDPRDTVVSAYYDALYRDKIFDKEISQFIRHPRFGIEKILWFHQLCFENQPLIKSSRVLNYEDLQLDTKVEIMSLMEFLAWDVSEQKLLQTLKSTSFEHMKKMEETGKFAEKYSYTLSPGDLDNPNSFKVRKGKVGGYKEELSEDDISFCNNAMKTNSNPFYPI